MQFLTGNPYLDGTNVFHGAGVQGVRRASTAWRPSRLVVAAADGAGCVRLAGEQGAVLTVAADAEYLRIDNMSALYTLPRLAALRLLGELELCDSPVMVVPDLSECGALWRIRLEQVPMEAVVANVGSPPALRVLELFMCEAMRSIGAGFVDRAQTLRSLTVRCVCVLRELCGAPARAATAARPLPVSGRRRPRASRQSWPDKAGRLYTAALTDARAHRSSTRHWPSAGWSAWPGWSCCR